MLNHFKHYPYFNMLPEQYFFQQHINILYVTYYMQYKPYSNVIYECRTVINITNDTRPWNESRVRLQKMRRKQRPSKLSKIRSNIESRLRNFVRYISVKYYGAADDDVEKDHVSHMILMKFLTEISMYSMRSNDSGRFFNWYSLDVA